MACSKSYASRQEIAQQGEKIARKHLQSINYKIHSTNVRFGHDEIDIVAFDPVDHVVVFIEVKSRAHLNRNFPPSLNLTNQKKKKLERSARAWTDHYQYEGGYRIDCILIAAGKIVDHYREITSM